MHQPVNLGLPHAPDGKLYLEDGGQRVLHVFPRLSSNDDQIRVLQGRLDGLVGRDGYDACIIHPNDVSDASRPQG